jgi:succinate-semialdehyde dehydrogenase/glutarate-semialdehyde dehydrogenase
MAQMFINGQQVDAADGQTMEIRNPADGSLVGSAPRAGAEDVEWAVVSAHAAFSGWSSTPSNQRAQLLIRAAEKLRAHLDEIASLLTAEQGKTLRESHIEAERLAENLEFFAGLTNAFRGDYVKLNDPRKYGLVIRRPLGVCVAIIPWNFPLTLMANKLCPALAVGNTMVIKPASTTPLATIRCIELMNEAGLPPGVLNVVTGPGGVVGEALISHPRVRKVAFTGETATGKRVMELAAGTVKRVTLELGGSDPCIVCDDADLDAAASAVSVGRFFNCGQACLAIKRLYVFESVYDEFVDRLVGRAKRLTLGPGTSPDTRVGPMHTANGRADIESFVDDAVGRGATVLHGARRPENPELSAGNYYTPTLLADVPADARVWSEETFGPVLPIARVKDLDEAITRANDSIFGLGSSIWTRDVARSRQAMEQLEAGYTWVNAMQIAHDELPFGGTKQSGYGKEHGTEVLGYYTEEKSVVIAS